MTQSSPRLEVPHDVAQVFKNFFATEFAYFTPKGEPLCWPVSPYWYPDRGVLAIATGLAYPNKAEYPKRNPKVALLFSDPIFSGLTDSPKVLVQGDATVLDEDIQANTDRYVREMRQKFPAAKLGLNPLTVRFLDFYLPRLWVEITPVRILVWRSTSSYPEIFGAPIPAPDASWRDQLREKARGPNMDHNATASTLAAWRAKYQDPVVTVRGPEGYPEIRRTRLSFSGSEIVVSDPPGAGPASLTFHYAKLGGIRFDARMARGHIEETDGRFVFVTHRLVGLLGDADKSLLGLSILSRIAELRRNLGSELERRGQSMPQLRIPR